MIETRTRYHRLAVLDGLEALDAVNHHTPFPFHYHPTFNISLIQGGAFRTQLQDRLVIAPSGSILVTNPGEVHANPCSAGNTVSFFTFYLSADLLRYCNNGSPVNFQSKIINDERLFTQLFRLSHKISLRPTEPPFEQYLIDALSRLAFLYGSCESEAETVSTRLFREILQEDNPERFSLDDTARRLAIDKFKFIRLFKSQTGLTPGNYFLLKRVEKSKRLLMGERDLLSIAIDLGFYDAAHFSHHFKKYTGMTPGTYRLAYQTSGDHNSS